MATTWYTCESGTVGAQVVAADNVAHVPATDVGPAALCGSAATMTFVADPMHGAKAVKIAGSTTAASWVRLNATGFSSLTGAATIYAKWDTAATQDNTVLAVLASGTKSFYLNRMGTNKWRITDQVSSAVWTSTSSVPVSAYTRIEATWTISSTASASGSLNLALYDGDTTTLLEPEQTLTLSLGTAPATAVYTGKFDSGTYAGAVTLDSYGFSDTSTTRLGRYISTNVPPTVSLTGTQNVAAGSAVTAIATATDSDGSIASFAWSVVSASSTATPTLTGATTTTVSFTAPAAGNLVTLQCIVTDNGGATATATTEVRVPITGATTARPLALTASGAAWTNTGGAASDGAALADASDTTYLESPSVTATETARRVRYQPSAARATFTLTQRLATDTGTANVTVRLYEGNTVRQTWTQAITTTLTDYPFAASAGTVSSIVDWGNLYAEVGATT